MVWSSLLLSHFSSHLTVTMQIELQPQDVKPAGSSGPPPHRKSKKAAQKEKQSERPRFGPQVPVGDKGTPAGAKETSLAAPSPKVSLEDAPKGKPKSKPKGKGTEGVGKSSRGPSGGPSGSGGKAKGKASEKPAANMSYGGGGVCRAFEGLQALETRGFKR